MPEDVIFQKKNALCYTFKVSISWFKRQGARVMKWPLQSPDLYPIKNLSEFGKWVRIHTHIFIHT